MKINLILILITALIFSAVGAIAQTKKPASTKPVLFNRTEFSYTFGLENALPNTNIDALHLKTVVGFTLPHIGFGIGLENGSFRGENNARFNTLAFSGNLHLLAKPNYYEGTNYFLKGAIGYGLGVFNNYDKGVNYEAATGIIITTKKRKRYFIQTIYHQQNIDDFLLVNEQLKIKTLGVGLGTWF
jgi:hypothetical protein